MQHADQQAAGYGNCRGSVIPATTAVVAPAQSPPGMKMYVFSSGALFLDLLYRHMLLSPCYSPFWQTQP